MEIQLLVAAAIVLAVTVAVAFVAIRRGRKRDR